MPTGKFQGAIGSTEKTASAAIMSGPGWLCDLLVVTDGTNNATAILKNALTDTGDVLAELSAVGNAHYASFTWNFPIRVTTGIYLVLSGTGASAFVSYIEDAS